MNINKITTSVQNSVTASKNSNSCDELITSFVIRTAEDIVELKKPKTVLQKKVLKMADEVWQDMKMPKSLKPQIVFRFMFPDKTGGTDFSSCKIYLPNEDSKLLTNMIITRGSKATLAHELRHAKQLYSIAQLIGADEFEKVAYEKQNVILDIGWFKYVVKELGRISPDSNEGKFAQKCLEGYINYPKMKHFEKPFSNAVQEIRYRHNFLEKDARQFEKEYQNIPLKNLFLAKLNKKN